eukprot:11005493-Alexandrium_andersonii.AAC.1
MFHEVPQAGGPSHRTSVPTTTPATHQRALRTTTHPVLATRDAGPRLTPTRAACASAGTADGA